MVSGKVALVTGSSRGLGKAIALELARQGYSVAVNCHESVDEGAAACGEIRALGVRSILVVGDTRSPEDVNRMLTEVETSLGNPDVLVNNAAYAAQKSFLDFTVDEWIGQVAYKSVGYFLTARRVLPGMLRKGAGVIINLLSTVGLRGGEGEIGYAVTNGGAMALTRGLASEFGERGIRVNGVMLTWAENAFDPSNPDHTAWLARFPLRRVTKADEVAETVAFLASPAASGITGALIPVDAGFLCR